MRILIKIKINLIINKPDIINFQNKSNLENIKIYVRPKHYYKIIKNADFAIVNGGITMFEFAAMGIPTLSLLNININCKILET